MAKIAASGRLGLVEANREAVAACWEAARTAGEDQRCTITVKAPGQ
ncbi:DUF6118 family protein [Sphingobium sp. CFD-1]|nr:DUF6118 family protein [Sphingobium sp. CFD-1]